MGALYEMASWELPAPMLVADIAGYFSWGRATEYCCLSLSGATVPAWIDHMPESGGGGGLEGSPAGVHFLQL